MLNDDRKCIQTINVFGHPLHGGCRETDAVFHHDLAFASDVCDVNDFHRQRCMHHEPKYEEREGQAQAREVPNANVE
jgi:hypothetical protein